MKRVDAPLARTSPSDLYEKESDGRNPPRGVAPHAHRGVVGAELSVLFTELYDMEDVLAIGHASL